MTALLLVFATVFLLNLVPAFAPPTWMAMSWIGFSRPDANPIVLATVAACAATAGRLVLARSARALVRNRLMRESDRQNVDVVRECIERKKGTTMSLVLLYAFSPFPSNYIFIAYGLTGMELWIIGLPFFLGRLVSYLTWTRLAQLSFLYLDPESEFEGAYFGIYFVLSQLAFVAIVYMFMKLDWETLLKRRKLRWRRSPKFRSKA